MLTEKEQHTTSTLTGFALRADVVRCTFQNTRARWAHSESSDSLLANPQPNQMETKGNTSEEQTYLDHGAVLALEDDLDEGTNEPLGELSLTYY